MRHDICLGMAASLSGRYCAQGTQALAGVRVWVEEVNRKGGLWVEAEAARFPVRFVHYDDESDPVRCQELTEHLIVEDGVDILQGPYSSGLALRAASVAAKHRRVLWNQGGASDRVYQLGKRWVGGVLTPASAYFHSVIEYARSQHPAVRRVAILHSTAGAFPRDVASGAARYLGHVGLPLVTTQRYQAGTEDFGAILRGLRRALPDLVLAVGRIEDDIRFAQQYVGGGIHLGIVALIAAGIERFGQTLGSGSEGFLAPSQWERGVVVDPDYGPGEDEVMQALAVTDDLVVDYPMVQGYAGCLIAQKCIEEGGTLDNGKLREVAMSLDFTTFYGRFRVESPTGRQTGHTMPVVQWRSGKKTVVWPQSELPTSLHARGPNPL